MSKPDIIIKAEFILQIIKVGLMIGVIIIGVLFLAGLKKQETKDCLKQLSIAAAKGANIEVLEWIKEECYGNTK